MGRECGHSARAGGDDQVWGGSVDMLQGLGGMTRCGWVESGTGVGSGVDTIWPPLRLTSPLPPLCVQHSGAHLLPGPVDVRPPCGPEALQWGAGAGHLREARPGGPGSGRLWGGTSVRLVATKVRSWKRCSAFEVEEQGWEASRPRILPSRNDHTPLTPCHQSGQLNLRPHPAPIPICRSKAPLSTLRCSSRMAACSHTR